VSCGVGCRAMSVECGVSLGRGAEGLKGEMEQKGLERREAKGPPLTHAEFRRRHVCIRRPAVLV
jgi:hypothetical protein